MSDAVPPPSDGSTHGFLFADLRGYTHLVDTRGSGGGWATYGGQRILFEALEDGPRTLTVVFETSDPAALSGFEQGAARTLLSSFVVVP